MNFPADCKPLAGGGTVLNRPKTEQELPLSKKHPREHSFGGAHTHIWKKPQLEKENEKKV